jgi:hypothetical protein
MSILATLAFAVWVQGASYDWTGGWAFGARRFVFYLPFISFGIAAVLVVCVRRPWVTVAMGLLLLAGFNLSLVGQVKDGRLPRGEAVSFTDASTNAVRDLYRSTGFPPTLPATAFLSWKYGIAPGRFDRILGMVPLDGQAVAIGTPADEAIRGRRWTVPHRNGETPYRWAIGEESTLLLTLARPCDRTLSFRLASADEGVPQLLAVRVNGELVGALRFGSGWTDLEVRAPARVSVPGINEVAFTASWARTSEMGALVRSAAAGKPISFRLANVAVSTCESN